MLRESEFANSTDTLNSLTSKSEFGQYKKTIGDNINIYKKHPTHCTTPFHYYKATKLQDKYHKKGRCKVQIKILHPVS